MNEFSPSPAGQGSKKRKLDDLAENTLETVEQLRDFLLDDDDEEEDESVDKLEEEVLLPPIEPKDAPKIPELAGKFAYKHMKVSW